MDNGIYLNQLSLLPRERTFLADVKHSGTLEYLTVKILIAFNVNTEEKQ